MPGVLKEFREFISRGNVVELAVAVVIGTAFTRVVNAVVAGFITPLIGMIGGSSFEKLTFTINKSPFTYGLVIDAIIAFLVVAAVVFFLVVKPINILNERRRRGVEPPTPEELSDGRAAHRDPRPPGRPGRGPGRSRGPGPVPAGPGRAAPAAAELPTGADRRTALDPRVVKRRRPRALSCGAAR